MHGLRDVVQELGFLARPRLGVEGADHQALDEAGGGGVLIFKVTIMTVISPRFIIQQTLSLETSLIWSSSSF